jgi:hypothetical protein
MHSSLEPGDSLPCWQEPVQSIPRRHNPFFKTRFNIILPSPSLPNGLDPSGFPSELSYKFPCPCHPAWLCHRNNICWNAQILKLVTAEVFQPPLLSSEAKVCPSAPSSFFRGHSVSLSTLFVQTLGLHLAWHIVSSPYTMKPEITVSLYINHFDFR